MSSWSRLVRFEDTNGAVKLGDLCIGKDENIGDKLQGRELHAVAFRESNPFGQLTRDKVVLVKKLLPVLQKSDVPIIRCIGLNYTKHSKFN